MREVPWMDSFATECIWFVGSFGLRDIPEALIKALRDTGVCDLTVSSNNAGVDECCLAFPWRRGRSAELSQAMWARMRSASDSSCMVNSRLSSPFKACSPNRCEPGRDRNPRFLYAYSVGSVVAQGKEQSDFEGAPYILALRDHVWGMASSSAIPLLSWRRQRDWNQPGVGRVESLSRS